MMKPIPPSRVAEAIVHGLAALRRLVWVPRLGYPFDLLNRFLPQFIDYYCAIKQRGWSAVSAKESAPKCG
jgi:hypothetical protein